MILGCLLAGPQDRGCISTAHSQVMLVIGKAIEDDGTINTNHLCPLSLHVTFILEKNSLILHPCISKRYNKYPGENGKQERASLQWNDVRGETSPYHMIYTHTIINGYTCDGRTVPGAMTENREQDTGKRTFSCGGDIWVETRREHG